MMKSQGLEQRGEQDHHKQVPRCTLQSDHIVPSIDDQQLNTSLAYTKIHIQSGKVPDPHMEIVSDLSNGLYIPIFPSSVKTSPYNFSMEHFHATQNPMHHKEKSISNPTRRPPPPWTRWVPVENFFSSPHRHTLPLGDCPPSTCTFICMVGCTRHRPRSIAIFLPLLDLLTLTSQRFMGIRCATF